MAVAGSGSEAKQSAAPVPSPTTDREIVQERVFDAPRELVWKAWTDPKHVDRWWGPNGFRNQTFSMDFRVGGLWKYAMHGPDGKVWPNWVRYEEIQEPERIAYAHGGEEGEPAHFQVTVTFVDEGGRTRVVMRSVFPNAEAVAAVKKFGAVEGGRQTLARLAGHLPYLADGTADRSMVITRLFDAPPETVFAAWSTKQAQDRWWGSNTGTTESVPNARIVKHAILEDLPGVEVPTTVTFTGEDGRTRLTVRQEIPNDEQAAKGQFEGWSQALERLAANI